MPHDLDCDAEAPTLMNRVILIGEAVHYIPMMELRWLRTKVGRHNNCILQQAWRGSDGSVDWRPIRVVDADG